jgi:hypothetical protein
MFRYVPSLAGAIVALVIFSIMTMLHAWQFLKSRQVIMIYVIVGAIRKFGYNIILHYSDTNTYDPVEVAGYGARIGSHFDDESWAAFIMGGVFLLTGPLFFAATIYMMLGRTIRLAGGEDVSLIKPRWYTRIFVAADVTTLIIQGLG